MRSHDSLTDTPLLKATAKATLPWFTTKNVMTSPANGPAENLNSLTFGCPPSPVYTSPLAPVASMNCAVLNQTRMAGLCRTNVSTITAVSPAISIGHGCSNRATDAIKGTKPTDVLTFANEILRNEESESTPKSANNAMALRVSREIP